MDTTNKQGPVDCACVIHGNGYDWHYVDKLYSMLNKNISYGVNLHVYTEASRVVPVHMIKHSLTDFGISGPKKSWWYKMQLFNPVHHAGPLLYFDLDVVITRNIDWMINLPTKYFWGLRDFKYLWRPTNYGINSSVMWWDTTKYSSVWNQFMHYPVADVIKRYHGDQDFISNAIPDCDRRFFDLERIKSWRWQALDGGYDFKRRNYKKPGTGTELLPSTSVLVFHGNPKPDKIDDPIIKHLWQ